MPCVYLLLYCVSVYLRQQQESTATLSRAQANSLLCGLFFNLWHGLENPDGVVTSEFDVATLLCQNAGITGDGVFCESKKVDAYRFVCVVLWATFLLSFSPFSLSSSLLFLSFFFTESSVTQGMSRLILGYFYRLAVRGFPAAAAVGAAVGPSTPLIFHRRVVPRSTFDIEVCVK